MDPDIELEEELELQDYLNSEIEDTITDEDIDFTETYGGDWQD